jgi:hypothetical protein
VNDGEPPRILAANFGAFQQIMSRITAEAAMSRASTAGDALLGTAVAAASQVFVKAMPAPRSRYRTITFTPVDTANEMKRSTYGAVQRDPPKPRKIKPAPTTR